MGKLIDGEDSLLDDDELEMSSDDQHSFGGVWTRIKLEALEKYLLAFNTALSKQSFTRLYIDAFAGTGRCDIKVDGEKKSIGRAGHRTSRGTSSHGGSVHGWRIGRDANQGETHRWKLTPGS